MPLIGKKTIVIGPKKVPVIDFSEGYGRQNHVFLVKRNRFWTSVDRDPPPFQRGAP
jgi:hypothetical protein